MAHIKALKQRWLQEYQQEQEGKLRAASSAALEGSTLNNGAAPDTASQPGTGADHLAGHPHGAVESPRHLPPKEAKQAAGALPNGAKAAQPTSPRHKPGKGEASGKLEGVGSGGLQPALGGSEDSNPSSSKQHAGGASKPGQQQPRKAAKKEGGGAAAGGTPVEVMLGDASKARHVGDVALPLCSSQEDLWAMIRSSFSAHIPGDAKARLVFQDLEGDWLLLQPGVPWELFTTSAKRLLVCNK